MRNLLAFTTIVVPCYNEAERFPADTFRAYAERQPEVRFVLVNDGSRDATLEILRSLEHQSPEQFRVIDQQPNQGKAEAVRTGMLAAFAAPECRYAGYWDADLATPLEAIPDFVQLLDERDPLQMVLGARVRLLGFHIDRTATRHILGRISATLTSWILSLPVYDTQCGAKMFRNDEAIRELFSTPFDTGWMFDVEIIARYARRTGWKLETLLDTIAELPLKRWEDVAGSKVRASDFPRAVLQLLKIFVRYRLLKAR